METSYRVATLRNVAIVAGAVSIALLMRAQPSAGAAPWVRIGYVVPESRTAQPQTAENLGAMLLDIQAWYGRQMERFGFGYKTFAIEMLPDSVTPRVHTVSTEVADATIRADIWGETIAAASDGGLSIWSPGEVWFLVSEAHLQNADGSIAGGTALGASFGSGDDPGVAMLGGDAIFRSHPDMLIDTRTYAGFAVPEVGPFPLVDDVSFPWFEGDTFSSIASSIQGAAAHELGHALGLGHDFRNDSNFDGILMGNGLRGWRGSMLPEMFSDDATQLGYAAALALNTSRYFNSEPAGDVIRPSVIINTSGVVDPVNGLLEVQFDASDASALAAAILRRNGETVAELALESTSISTSIATPYYEVGSNDDFELSVYDVFGNRTNANVSIEVSVGLNRAPQPFVDLSHDTATYFETVTLDASRSVDPDGSQAGVTVEWDLDGDGQFDTPPATDLTLTTSYDLPGDYLIRARLTDAAGDHAISPPVSLIVEGLPGDVNVDGSVDGADFLEIQRSNLAQISEWTSHYGRPSAVSPGVVSLPEPATLEMLVLGITAFAKTSWRLRACPNRLL